MENNHINYKGKIIEVPQISSDDEACEILKDVDFTSTEDLAKAVVSVANYIESTKSALQALETALAQSHKEEVETLRAENKRLRFIVENGLGPKDLENDNTYPR